MKGNFHARFLGGRERATARAYPVPIRTHAGSVAFANPAITMLATPSGDPALLVTAYLFHSGAAPGEAGPLLYFRPLATAGALR